MGNSGSYRQAGNQPQQDPRNYFQVDLPKFILQSKIGNGKFMKTYSVRVDGSTLVVKVYMKLPEEDKELQLVVEKLTKIWKVLSPSRYPNLLPYQMWIKSVDKTQSSLRTQKQIPSPVYLIRQYIYANLHDRLSTRPFLNELEKLWFVYQLIKCVEICHSHGIVHGDIKPENVMCTTWNWLILTDISPFKPSTLPDDDPTDFQYYFDTMGRSSCYLAPERFYHREVHSGGYKRGNVDMTNQIASMDLRDVDWEHGAISAALGGKTPLTPTMDAFSLGCTIAEIFLDGEALLDLPGMLQYLQTQSLKTPGTFTPGGNAATMERLDHEDSPAKGAISRIKNKLIREVIIDMTQKNPDMRSPVSNYRYILEGRLSPSKMTSWVASGNSLADDPIAETAEGANREMLPLPPSQAIPAAFPPYFSKSMHPLFHRLHVKGITGDDRIAIICDCYGDLVSNITGHEDPDGVHFFGTVMKAVLGQFTKVGTNTAQNNNATTTPSKADNGTVSKTTPSNARQSMARPSMIAGSADQHLLAAASSVAGNLTVESLQHARLRKLPDRSGKETVSYKELHSTNFAVNEMSLHSKENDAKEPLNEFDIKLAFEERDFRELSVNELLAECKKLLDEADPYANMEKEKPENSDIIPPMSAAIDESLVSKHVEGARHQEEIRPHGEYEDLISNQLLTSQHIMDAALRTSYGVDSICCNKNSSSSYRSFLELPLKTTHQHSGEERPTFEGFLLPLQVVCSVFRHLKHPQSKLVAMMLIARLGAQCTDGVILHRLVPTLILAVEDPVAMIRATAVRALRTLLSAVKNVSAMESNIFPLYIFPVLNNVVAKDPELVVRIAFAESIARIAETAKRFLDQAHLAAQIRASVGNNSSDTQEMMSDDNTSNAPMIPKTAIDEGNHVVDFPYDLKLKELHDQVNRWIGDLLLDSGDSAMNTAEQGVTDKSMTIGTGSMIKRVLLVDIMRLCVFFGQEATMELLQYVLTFLNDGDWELRYAFCAKISSVCAFVGPTVTCEYILPWVENALADSEERVVVRAVQCLTTLVELDLLSNFVIVDSVSNVIPLILHPCESIRRSAIALCAAAIKALGNTDAMVFLLPLLQPVLRYDLAGIALSSEIISLAIRPPISQAAYRQMILKKLYPTSNDLTSIKSPEPKKVADNVVQEKTDSNGSLGDIDEEAKLAFIGPYIDRCVQEINVKINLSRQAGNNPSNVPSVLSKRGASGKGKNTTFGAMDSLIDMSLTSLPDHALKSLLIPHQKYGVHLFPPVAEPSRSAAALDPTSIKSSQKLRSLYGLITSQGDVARALAAGVDQMEVVGMNQDHRSLANAPGGRRGVSVAFQRSGTAIAEASMQSNLSPPPKDGTASAFSQRGATQDTRSLIRRIQALGVVPLPPNVGSLVQAVDDRKYNLYTEGLDLSQFVDPVSRSHWRPRENVLVTSLFEHTHAVNQLAVAVDQSFFASASSDKTVKLWKVRGLDRNSFPKSLHTYEGHRGGVLSVAILENSHSIASTSDDGSIHVWRVDSGGKPDSNMTSPDSANRGGSRISTSEVKNISTVEGPVIAVNHYNSDVASVLMYVTQKGGVHGWDLRSVGEAFNYQIRPELGHPTSSTLAPDRSWICIGTSRGYIALWDLRYNIMSKLWRHSSRSTIHRLACCKSLPRNMNIQQSQREFGMPSTEGAYLFVAAGQSEAAVWGIPEGGECLKCFRSISLASSKRSLDLLPFLEEIPLPRHPNAPIWSAIQDTSSNNSSVNEPSVRAIMGRISQSGTSFLVTAGTDKVIRYWDFSAPTKCFTVAGLLPAQPKPNFETPAVEGLHGKLFVCYDSAIPSADITMPAHLPIREGRGALQPTPSYNDAILDLKSVDIPIRLMLSAGKDGGIRLWR